MALRISPQDEGLRSLIGKVMLTEDYRLKPVGSGES